MSTLQNQLAAVERDEVARAIRTLLGTPVLTRRGDPEGYDLVRRRAQTLTTWFGHYAGWAFTLDTRHGVARLAKVPADRVDAEDLRPVLRPRAGKAPFDRLRYVLLCICAAELVERRDVTIGELAEQVAQACASDPELPVFRTDHQEHRRAFADALVVLESTGGVTAIDGDTAAYADDASSSVLYRVAPEMLYQVLSAPVGPSALADDRPDLGFDAPALALLDEPVYGPEYRRWASQQPGDGDPRRPSHEQRTRWARHSALRVLLEDTVLYVEDLTAAQAAYLATTGGRGQVRQAAAQAGFVLEERAEGLALVDPSRLSSGERFPDASTSSVAGLYLLGVLRRHGDGGVSTAALTEALRELLADEPGWTRTFRDDDGAARLTDEALRTLAAHKLVRRASAGSATWLARPAAARYRDATVRRRPARNVSVERVETAPLFDLDQAAP